MKLALIFARASNGVIGKDGALPWRLPEDMAHFKRKTLGCPVMMGRKTWDSLPARFRPLPGRTNIVLTRQAGWQTQCVVRAGSLAEAMNLCAAEPVAWVIGGADLYAQALPLASSAEITEIDASFDGDAYAPALGPGWIEVARERHTSAGGLNYSFVTHHNTQRGN